LTYFCHNDYLNKILKKGNYTQKFAVFLYKFDLLY
jgi:hypothetical protein